MITINLLPKTFKRAEKKVQIPYKAIFLSVAALLVTLHLLLFSVQFLKGVQLLSLKASWSRMAPQSKDSATTQKGVKDVEGKVKAMKEVLNRRVSLTELMSDLNAAVPKGLWLERFTFSQDGLVIQGSVISLTQNEMTIIGNFLQDVRAAASFSSAFPKIELTSVQRRTIKTYDVVDFVITGATGVLKK